MTNNKIKDLRLAKHLSQEQLAEKAQVSVRKIQRLETGDDASITTLNLVAGALEVNVKDLFEDLPSEKTKEKIYTADEQLQYQLQRRHEEFSIYKRLINAIYVILMLIWASSFWYFEDENYYIMSLLWVDSWMIFAPLKKWIIINLIDPRLDKKYSLTISRLDKDY